MCFAVILSGCARMFRTDKGYVPKGCLFYAPGCAFHQQDSVAAGIAWGATAALIYPALLFAVVNQGLVDNCHSRGGRWVCVGSDCNCVTVN